ncbi:ribose 5-phosphate isomerase B [Pedobacter yulinensis]|uniref:Ribose 5-phosphate isomerase B n=1 Tax=Pedobacter yulinensis TaxID=2126353 RepID=A0A2T3HP83_9SPHI|nr:ribose 5-phosphate isomerase B [Pedobacter yulinensis]PST84217.1 ribose 5-phosphate isomerase B [Pedobacter yulinensis]
MSENKKLKIAIGADHAGFDYKEMLRDYLANQYELKDFGTYSSESADYPDFAHPVSLAVESGEFDFGVLVCGSGQGVAITANKHQHIRAALCWTVDIARLSRQHNNANVICIPSRFVSEGLATEMTEAFLTTDFEGGRHSRRVDKIEC